MNADVASMMHYVAYGKSDKVNAADNQNPDFQSGYRIGHVARDDAQFVAQQISLEYLRRGRDSLHSAEFAEWKRGVYAAHVQWLFALAIN